MYKLVSWISSRKVSIAAGLTLGTTSSWCNNNFLNQNQPKKFKSEPAKILCSTICEYNGSIKGSTRYLGPRGSVSRTIPTDSTFAAIIGSVYLRILVSDISSTLKLAWRIQSLSNKPAEQYCGCMVFARLLFGRRRERNRNPNTWFRKMGCQQKLGSSFPV